MGLPVKTRRELMKFEVVLQRGKDAANDAGKTSGRDGVADDQDAMQIYNPTRRTYSAKRGSPRSGSQIGFTFR